MVEVTGGMEEKMSPEEAGKLAEQILKGERPAEQGYSRLEEMYHKYGSKEMLSDICSHFIKNGSTDRESFFWYQRGVQAELKITKLYEYFMRAVPEDKQSPSQKKPAPVFSDGKYAEQHPEGMSLREYCPGSRHRTRIFTAL